MCKDNKCKSFALDIQIGAYNNSCLQTQFYCPLLSTLDNYGLLSGTLSSLCIHLSKTQSLNWLNCFSEPSLKNILFDCLHNRKTHTVKMTIKILSIPLCIFEKKLNGQNKVNIFGFSQFVDSIH